MPDPIIDDPESFLDELKSSGIKADLFSFSQKIPDVRPRHSYAMELDNVAAIPILTYRDWWESLSTDARKDVKRAVKRGVVVREIGFDDELVWGIMGIHDEVPIRQGRKFRHFGKDFATVQREYSTYLERSVFVAAYFRSELIGVVKMVEVGESACIMEILSKTFHHDKRPTNALIAKAVEICVDRGKMYLTYGPLHYGNKTRSSVVDFKRRNAFELILFPRYFVFLTFKGRIAFRLGLHKGWLGILPGFMISLGVGLRARFCKKKSLQGKPPNRSRGLSREDALSGD